MSIALITGVSGQDGRYLAPRLRAAGFEVHGTVVSRDDSGIFEGVEATHPVDMSRPGVGELVRSLAPDLVVNLAAVSSVARSWQDPLTTAAVNGLAVAEILAALSGLAAAGASPRFIQASSAEIFGIADSATQDEATPLRPVSPYGASKAYAHQLTDLYRGAGLWAAACILYNHESPIRPATFVTRKISRAAARISLGLDDKLELGLLETRRDWGWAPDYVDAIVRLAIHDSPDDFVIATGEEHSIEDFVRIAFTHAGIKDWRRHVDVSSELVRPADPGRLVGDASRARSELGWVPTVSFEELVERMVDNDLELARLGDLG